MLEKDPGLNPDTVKARLMRSARKIDGDPTVVGAGVQDASPLYTTSAGSIGLNDD